MGLLEFLLPAGDSDEYPDRVEFSSIKQLVMPVFIPRLIQQIVMGMMTVVLPMQALERHGSYAMAGYLVAAQGAGQFVMNYPAGKMTNLYNPKLVVLVCAVSTLVGSLVCAAAPSGMFGIVFLSIGAFLIGSADAGETMGHQIYVAATTQSDALGMSMSSFGAMQRIGFCLGPLLAGVVLRHFGAVAVYIMQAAIGGMMLFWVKHYMPYARADQQVGNNTPTRLRFGKKDELTFMGVVRNYGRLILTAGIFSIGLTFCRQARNLLIPLVGHSLDLSQDRIGTYVSLSYVVDACLFPIAGWLLTNAGRNCTGALSTGVYAVAFLTLHGRTPFALLLFAVGTGVANGFSSGLVLAIGTDLAPVHARGPFVGVYRTIGRAAEMLCPMVVGPLAQHASLAVTGDCSALIALFSLIWVSCILREVRPTPS